MARSIEYTADLTEQDTRLRRRVLRVVVLWSCGRSKSGDGHTTMDEAAPAPAEIYPCLKPPLESRLNMVLNIRARFFMSERIFFVLLIQF